VFRPQGLLREGGEVEEIGEGEEGPRCRHRDSCKSEGAGPAERGGGEGPSCLSGGQRRGGRGLGPRALPAPQAGGTGCTQALTPADPESAHGPPSLILAPAAGPTARECPPVGTGAARATQGLLRQGEDWGGQPPFFPATHPGQATSCESPDGSPMAWQTACLPAEAKVRGCSQEGRRTWPCSVVRGLHQPEQCPGAGGPAGGVGEGGSVKAWLGCPKAKEVDS